MTHTQHKTTQTNRSATHYEPCSDTSALTALTLTEQTMGKRRKLACHCFVLFRPPLRNCSDARLAPTTGTTLLPPAGDTTNSELRNPRPSVRSARSSPRKRHDARHRTRRTRTTHHMNGGVIATAAAHSNPIAKFLLTIINSFILDRITFGLRKFYAVPEEFARRGCLINYYS